MCKEAPPGHVPAGLLHENGHTEKRPQAAAGEGKRGGLTRRRNASKYQLVELLSRFMAESGRGRGNFQQRKGAEAPKRDEKFSLA